MTPIIFGGSENAVIREAKFSSMPKRPDEIPNPSEEPTAIPPEEQPAPIRPLKEPEIRPNPEPFPSTLPREVPTPQEKFSFEN